VGVRLHVLTNLLDELVKENRPMHRLVLRDLLRLDSFPWRFETLYVWDRSRDSANQGLTTAGHALDLRIRRVW
jgi:hypothetical protein